MRPEEEIINAWSPRGAGGVKATASQWERLAGLIHDGLVIARSEERDNVLNAVDELIAQRDISGAMIRPADVGRLRATTSPKRAQQRTRTITPERLLEENEALRQIIREALPLAESSVCPKCNAEVERYGPLLERMRAAIGSE